MDLLKGIDNEKIGLDCSVVPLPNSLSLISTTDYFYPLVDDPYIQGKIGACNVLSDMYAMGITKIDNMLMILAASADMQPNDRDIVTRSMIRGFNDTCKEASVEVTGGQTVVNPWPIIGGTAMSCCLPNQFIYPDGAQPGDVLVLTKPLGTQLVSNLNEWLLLGKNHHLDKCKDIINMEVAKKAFITAVASMTRLNKNAAMLMHKYGAHAATDITGFGIIGHARNLAQHQKKSVKFIIDHLPIIEGIAQLDPLYPFFKLLKGLSAETSGGLFIALPEHAAHNYIKELQELDNAPAWIVGKVIEGEGTNDAILTDPITILHI